MANSKVFLCLLTCFTTLPEFQEIDEMFYERRRALRIWRTIRWLSVSFTLENRYYSYNLKNHKAGFYYDFDEHFESKFTHHCSQFSSISECNLSLELSSAKDHSIYLFSLAGQFQWQNGLLARRKSYSKPLNRENETFLHNSVVR